MPANSSRIFIEGEMVDFTTGNLSKQGNNTASSLTFTIPGGQANYRKYWNKEVTFFLDSSDAKPMFRGAIINAEINANNAVTFRALDALGYLTGRQRASLNFDETNNIDGLTIGGALTTMVRNAKLTKVGVDYMNDTNPVKKMPPLRGKHFILDTIVQQLGDIYNDVKEIPRTNILTVTDDGKKGQLGFVLLKDVDETTPSFHYNYNNMITFNVINRKIPTIITVTGKNSNFTLHHESAASGLGDNFLNVTNNNLTSRADCADFAQKVFNANIKNKYEYNLSTYEGAYLEENDVISIVDDNTGIEGNFRIVGKSIDFGEGAYSLSLTINKQPPLVSEFLS